MRHVVLSSNRWFSAVSDYCLQLMVYLTSHRGEAVTFAAQRGSPLEARCERIGVPFREIPLWPSKLSNQIRSWRRIGRLMRENAAHDTLCVWTFEGREHTLCALHRKAYPKLWRNAILVRVRGQAAHAKTTSMSKWLYGKAADKVIFAADVVRERTPISIATGRARIQHYCVDWRCSEQAPARRAGHYAFAPGLPSIDFSAPVILVLGRYDPVKGHTWMLEAFRQLQRNTFSNPGPVQLVFIGKSENVQAAQLHAKAQELLGQGSVVGNRYYASDSADTKRVFIFDERLPDACIFVRQAHFGVIPSLGSEVICRVAVEFLQAGTPVLAATVGALPEVLPPESGSLLVPPGDVEALTQALEQSLHLLEASPEEYESLRQKSLHFGRERYALERLEETIRWVTEAAPRRT